MSRRGTVRRGWDIHTRAEDLEPPAEPNTVSAASVQSKADSRASLLQQPRTASAVSAQTVEVRVSGVGGRLCAVSHRAGASLEELQAAIEAATGIPEETQRLFDGVLELDKSDIRLNPADGCEHVELLLVRRSVEQVDDRKVQSVYRLIDSDADGLITPEELKLAYGAVLLMAGDTLDPTRISEWVARNFQKYDKDDSATLDLREFKRFLQYSEGLTRILDFASMF